MLNGLVYKLLYRHISVWQMAGFTLANLCGMTIVVAAIQFAADVLPLFSGNDSFMRPGQIVITKRVNYFSSLSGSTPVFSGEEIKDIREQSFTKSVGLFLPSQYKVYATIGSRDMGMEFSTQMFFESLPDEFIDVNLNQWKYDAGSDSVPIILPRNYLNLYNFGYATSQGLPTISEGIIKQIGIRLQLSGDQASVVRHGKVVAFSRSLNTILVPQTFMQEYNKTLSPGRTPRPSRLAIIATNIGDSKIADYLDAHGYDTEGNDADSAKTASFLRITTIIVSAVGIIICILSFYVLILSIFLLLQKHTEIIDSLLLIGYSPRSVAMPFYILAIGLNTIVAIAAVWISALLRDYYLPRFGELYPQLDTTEILPSLTAATAIYLLMCILNTCAVRRKINSIWHLHE